MREEGFVSWSLKRGYEFRSGGWYPTEETIIEVDEVPEAGAIPCRLSGQHPLGANSAWGLCGPVGDPPGLHVDQIWMRPPDPPGAIAMISV